MLPNKIGNLVAKLGRKLFCTKRAPRNFNFQCLFFSSPLIRETAPCPKIGAIKGEQGAQWENDFLAQEFGSVVGVSNKP